MPLVSVQLNFECVLGNFLKENGKLINPEPILKNTIKMRRWEGRHTGPLVAWMEQQLNQFEPVPSAGL